MMALMLLVFPQSLHHYPSDLHLDENKLSDRYAPLIRFLSLDEDLHMAL